MKGLFCKLKKNQFGRTMTEMLGVLAVIGVLSIGAISGYRLSMNKLRANELINEMNTRRVALYQQFLKDPENVDMEMGEQTKQGYKISAETDKSEENVFYMKVETIPLGVCKELLSRNWKAPLSIYVDDVLAKNGETSGCGENDTVKMTFKFDKYGDSSHEADGDNEEVTTPPLCPTDEFMDSAGVCRSCSATGGYISNASQCAACGGTDTPREMVGEYCALKRECATDQFKGSSGCYSCSVTAGYESDAARCAACDNTANNREMVGDRCVPKKECTANQFRAANGSCYSCDVTASYESDASHCAACDDTDYPREMVSKYCVRKYECAKGQFKGSGGSCRSCSNPSGYGSDAVQCAACDSTETPREMLDNGKCALVTCPWGQFRLSIGDCYSCSGSESVQSDVAHCGACDTTAYPREMMDNTCVLKRECGEDQFMGLYGYCYSCSSKSSLPSDAARCAACDSTANKREMVGDRCVPKKECTANQFRASDGSCYSCSVTANYASDASHCAACDNTANKREMVGDLCVLKKECAAGEFKTANGSCNSCSEAYARASDAAQCALCDGTKYPREMIGDLCALVACPSGQFRDSDGRCRSCADSGYYKSDASHCAACDTTAYPREILGEYCLLKKECSAGQFRASLGACYSCSVTAGYKSNAAHCAACDDTEYPREMVGDYCGLKCTAGKFKDSWGYCKSCSSTSSSTSDAAHCAVCGDEREMAGDQCTLKCSVGKFHDNSGYCHLCTTLSAPESTNELCAVCDGVGVHRKIVDGKCVLADS